MIERLLAAERALAADQLEVAHRLFAQVAGADPRNAIALTGLAKVAVRRSDMPTARLHVTHALAIDPEDAAAQALAAELGVKATEPAAAPGVAPASAGPTPAEPIPTAAAHPRPKPGPKPGAKPSRPATRGSHGSAPAKAVPRKRGLLARLVRAFLGRD